MRIARLVSALLVAAALLALPADAKNGVRAKLLNRVDLATAPGKSVRVVWKLEDADGRAFGASGIYLRVSRCGHGPMRVSATPGTVNGRFSARFKVPEGGVRKLMVGLEGWQVFPSGRTQRRDATFNFVPALGRDCV